MPIGSAQNAAISVTSICHRDLAARNLSRRRETFPALAHEACAIAGAARGMSIASRPQGGNMAKRSHVETTGFCISGFEGVRDAFDENFAMRKELGGACSVYY